MAAVRQSQIINKMYSYAITKKCSDSGTVSRLIAVHPWRLVKSYCCVGPAVLQRGAVRSRGFPLTVDGGRDHHVQHLAAVARIKELVGPQGVEAQRTPARLVLRLHHHHHIETVAREVLPLQGKRADKSRQGQA